MAQKRITSPERHEMILDLLRARGPLSVGFLGENLVVSAETIRRDLATLEKQGRLQRNHGGARLAPVYQLPHIDERIGLEQVAKTRIAALAANLVAPGMSIFMGGGSTVLRLAHQLCEVPRLTVSTVMVDVAMVMAANRNNEVSLCGGRLVSESRACTSYEAVEMVLRRRFDIAFLGVSGLDAQRGILGPSEQHLHLAQALRARSQSLVVLAPHTAMQYQDRLQILPLEASDVLITNRPLTPALFSALEVANVKILF